jgi:hypothetical protein
MGMLTGVCLPSSEVGQLPIGGGKLSYLSMSGSELLD